ncbi:MAG: peptide deformylase [Endomicrobium sp.]|nr:peptide deformylase [Endomicrobium sp.]
MSIITDTTILSLISKEVQLENIPKDLIIQMKKFNKGIGLSAIQLGVPLRIFRLRNPDLIFINPMLLKESRFCLCKESCISRPGIRVYKVRPTSLVVKAFNEKGELFYFIAEYIIARIISHELDHLNGIYLGME